MGSAPAPGCSSTRPRVESPHSRRGRRESHARRVCSPSIFVRPKPMFVRQTSGHFTTLTEKIIVRHERYFFTISQQKPGKRNFFENVFYDLSRGSLPTLRSTATEDGWRRRVSQQKPGKCYFGEFFLTADYVDGR
jgi:hypothetical protein